MTSSNAPSLEGAMKELGYDVRAPGQLRGKSGVLHSFTLCAHKGKENEVAIEVDSLGTPAEISILAFYAKALDTDLERSILITNASLDSGAKRLAALYNILVIPSRIRPEDLRRQLRNFLSLNRTASITGSDH